MGFSEGSYYREKFAGLSAIKESFKSLRFDECQFNTCSFIDCRFEKCKFLNCKFNDCVLSAVVPLDCHFVEVKFSRSKAIGIDWTKTSKIEDLEFNECQINYSNFKLLKIPKIKIVKCEAREVDFIETDMSEGDFKRSDFEKSRFFKTNLTRADFKNAINYSIDVKNNTIKNAHFSLPEALSLLNSLDIIIE
jgi:uncharacterized protein YjbI with pentapeptide repeats